VLATADLPQPFAGSTVEVQRLPRPTFRTVVLLTQNLKRAGGSAIDQRTTQHHSYQMSQKKRPLIEKAFGWMKQTAEFARPNYADYGRSDGNS
jgi:hypothetical protein